MQLEFDPRSEINSKQAGVVSNLVRKKYKEDTLINEYIKNKEIIECSEIRAYGVNFGILEAFENIDTILELSGEEKIFNKITEQIQPKIKEAKSFVSTHRDQELLISVHYHWVKTSGTWICDPVKNFHERMDAIMIINRALEHNVFNKEDVEILCQIFTLKN